MTAGATLHARPRSGALGDALAIVRYHIMLVAMTASVVFGWLMTGRYVLWLPAVVGLDWFFINLLNRVTDVDEDMKNGIRGTERVARRRRALTAGSFAAMVASFALTHAVWPALTPWRIAVQLIGLGYNYSIVPIPRGLAGIGADHVDRERWGALVLRRFKEIYFLKNFGSAVLFVLTCFAYPLALAHAEGARVMSWGGIATLIFFFVPYELTFEIIYDLRDLEGDRAERVPTFPVVHGVVRARQIVDALLGLASAALLVGFFLRQIGVRELLMLAAPPIQFAFYRRRLARGLTPRDCIVLTHMATALLVFYLAGTAVWMRLGLPPNISLH